MNQLYQHLTHNPLLADSDVILDPKPVVQLRLFPSQGEVYMRRVWEHGRWAQQKIDEVQRSKRLGAGDYATTCTC